jgi:hypothetical protein
MKPDRLSILYLKKEGFGQSLNQIDQVTVYLVGDQEARLYDPGVSSCILAPTCISKICSNVKDVVEIVSCG